MSRRTRAQRKRMRISIRVYIYLNFSENRYKQCNQSKYMLKKTHKDYVEIFLLFADVAVLDCFS